MKNRKKDQFDRILKSTLDSQADHVRMSSGLEYRIRQSIYENGKEKYVMKMGKKKKIAIALAAVCILGSITAAAAGKVSGYHSHSWANKDEIKSFADVEKAEDAVGYQLKAVETFASGYTLKKGHIVDTEAVDSEDNVVDTYKEVMLDYEKDGTVVTLVEQPMADYKKEDPDHPNQKQIACGDITLTYREDPYKFVPPDYEPTEEEKAAMEAKELYISYGTDKVQEAEYHFLTWNQGDILYTFMCYDEGGPGAEEMTEMAKELIELEE